MVRRLTLRPLFWFLSGFPLSMEFVVLSLLGEVDSAACGSPVFNNTRRDMDCGTYLHE